MIKRFEPGTLVFDGKDILTIKNVNDKLTTKYVDDITDGNGINFLIYEVEKKDRIINIAHEKLFDYRIAYLEEILKKGLYVYYNHDKPAMQISDHDQYDYQTVRCTYNLTTNEWEVNDE